MPRSRLDQGTLRPLDHQSWHRPSLACVSLFEASQLPPVPWRCPCRSGVHTAPLRLRQLRLHHGRFCLPLGHAGTGGRKLTVHMSEPPLQIRPRVAPTSGGIGAPIGRERPHFGQRRGKGRHGPRCQRARAVEGANEGELHPREHPVRRRPQKALTAGELRQLGQNAPTVGTIRLRLDSAVRSHRKCPASGMIAAAATG